MIAFVLRRIAVFTIRIFLAALLLLALIEFSFGVVGSGLSGRNDSFSARVEEHVWEIHLSAPAPASLDAGGRDAWDLVSTRLPVSAGSFLPAMFATWVVGYAWGTLGARFRSVRADLALRSPFSVGACVPGFWMVLMVAVYTYLVRSRPGFAGELRVETGPDLIAWWNSLVVALPLVLAGAASQMKGVSEVLHRHLCETSRSEMLRVGFRPEDVFYRRAWKAASGALVAQLDRTVPLVLGGLILTESAFRQEGIGSLLVDSIRAGYLSGVFLTAMIFATATALFALVREFLVKLTERGAA